MVSIQYIVIAVTTILNQLSTQTTFIMQKRRLAAIMFTDIVGYTKMMQINEDKAIVALDQHKTTVEQKVLEFNGKTIKFYGDGSLSIFESVYQAVACALEIQQSLRKSPKVPIRIGIHTGEVISRDGDIYGDGINIAARLQSFGEEGSIIFSGDVHDKIKNHPELQSVYLGKHILKNVLNRFEIYALSNPGIPIPRKSKIQKNMDDSDPKKILKFKFRKFHSYILIALSLIICTAIIALKIKQKREIQFALNNTVPAIKEEIKYVSETAGKRNWDIYNKALDLKKVLKDNHDFINLWNDITFSLTIRTNPSRAKVYAKPYSNPDTSWLYLGKTPVLNYPFPRGLSRIKIDLIDYETQHDLILRHFTYSASGKTKQYQLYRKSEMPEGMVFVPGNIGKSWRTDEFSDLYVGDYWIDRYEVTNSQYKNFLDSDGYVNPKYWQFPFIDEDDTLTTTEAMMRFEDRIGWQGPATWELGDFPNGEGELPVSGISWYEAAAYANFVNKDLPTILHWLRVSRVGATAEIVKFGNFNKKGLVKKNTYNSLTGYGTFDLAGNVSEWIFNSVGPNRFLLGGNYKEPSYWYNLEGTISPWTRNELIGFRCIRYVDDTLKHKLTQSTDWTRRDFNKANPVSDEIFKVYLDFFDYNKTKLKPIQIRNGETEKWSFEIISVEVPYEDTPLKILLCLPLNFEPPYQSIIYFPGADAGQSSNLEDMMNYMANMNEYGSFDFFLKSGRALIWPVYYGTFGRGKNKTRNAHAWEQRFKYRMIDIQIVCDYLLTRDDVDSERIAYYGLSWGGFIAPYALAIEDRIKLGILGLFGVQTKEEWKGFDQINYLPRVKVPMLLLGGQFDMDYTLDQQQAFYDFLGTSEIDKKWMLYESSHYIPRYDLVNESLNWLDKYFGPVSDTIQ